MDSEPSIKQLNPEWSDGEKLQKAKQYVDSKLLDLPDDKAMEYILAVCERLNLKREYRTNLKDHYKAKKKEKPEETPYEYPKEIQELANKILSCGDPLEFMLDTYNIRHVGDRNIAENCLCAVASTYILNSKGEHVKSSGDSGKGKSDGMTTVLQLLPEDKYINASISSKALFYNKKLKPGTIIYSDDADFNSDTISTLKQATSSFQKPTTHMTVSNQVGEEHTIPERCSFWFSNVDGIGDEQLANRFLNADIDSSKAQDEKVHDHSNEAELYLNSSVDDDLLICRCMFSILGNEICIKIPYLKAIDWKNKENRRNYSKFKDILRSVTFFKLKQREYINGFYLADIEDFDVALRIYKGTAKNNATNLTDTEMKVLKFLKGKPRTIMDVTAHIEKSRAWALTVLQGRDSKGGMLAKVPGLSKDYVEKKKMATVDDMSGDINDEVTTRAYYYSYKGSVDFSIYDNVATLDYEKAIAEREEFIRSVTTVTMLSPNCHPSEVTLKTSTVERISSNCNLNNNNIIDNTVTVQNKSLSHFENSGYTVTLEG